MDIKTFLQIVPNLPADISVLASGPTGVGKSDMFHQIGELRRSGRGRLLPQAVQHGPREQAQRNTREGKTGSSGCSMTPPAARNQRMTPAGVASYFFSGGFVHIGTVNGILDGYKFGSQFALDILAKDGIITEKDKTVYLEALKFKVPSNVTEQQIFKIVWRYINKHPEKRHMDLSTLTFMAINESFK